MTVINHQIDQFHRQLECNNDKPVLDNIDSTLDFTRGMARQPDGSLSFEDGTTAKSHLRLSVFLKIM